jgi:GST-like protein
MIQLFFHATPNSMKVALLLEELDLAYDVVPVDIFKGEQHAPVLLGVNPNAKVPALLDDGVAVFDSHAILLHLAEKHGRFLPAEPAARARALSWLMLVATGLGPFSGQAIHFLHYAPERLPYAVNRYVREVERHYGVLDARLAQAPFLAGEEYSIADMALWAWANSSAYVRGERKLDGFPHLQAFMERIGQRPALGRALALRGRHQFKADIDAETRAALFPQSAPA